MTTCWPTAKAQNAADFAGYIIRGKATNPVVADFLPILWSFGGDVFDENWNVVFDSPESLAAVKFLVDDLKAVAQADPGQHDAADRDQHHGNGRRATSPRSGRARSTRACSGRARRSRPRQGLLHPHPQGPVAARAWA